MMKNLSLFCLFFSSFIYSGASAQGTGQTILSVPEFVSVNADSQIKMKDIISPSEESIDSPLWKKLSNISLDLTVEDGKSKVIGASYVSKLIRSDLSFSELKSLSLRLPYEITLNGKKSFMSQVRIKNEIRSHYKTLCSDCSIEIQDLKLPMSLDAFSEWSLLFSEERIVRSPRLKLLLMSPNGNIEAPLAVQMAAFKNYLAANRKLEAGSVLSDKDFVTRRIDMTQMTDISPKMDELKGRKLNRTLLPGEVLLQSHLTKNILVKSGQETKGILEDGLIKVEFAVIPQSNGALGETIQVRSVETKKTLRAVVLENGKVMIQ